MTPRRTPRFVALLLAGMLSLVIAPAVQAQSPAELEDAEAARQKLLRATDQIELMHTQLDDLRQQVGKLSGELAGLKGDQDALQSQVTQLKSDNAALRSALDKADAARGKERDVLLAEVGKIVAGGQKKSTPPPADPTPDTAPDHSNETGFYHVVEGGQSLWSIADAYSKAGVPVTIDDIRKANGLDKKASIRTGQKLFIPKK